MDQGRQPQQRELVFCHQCENEWYRDEHGIICPECQSDFTEIIEEDHDPRDDDNHIPADPQHPGGGNHEWYAPDPDEGDIDDFHWHNNGPGQPPGGRFTGTFTRNFTLGGPNGQNANMGGGGMGGGLMGILGPALQGLLGGQQRPQQPDGLGQERGTPGPEGEHQDQLQDQQQPGNGGTFVRHGSGPGYSFTITTSSNANLFPRNANGPQPMNAQPDNIERMMAQMFMNIGAMPGQGFGGGGMRAGPGGPMFMGVGGGGGVMHGGMHGGGPVAIGDLFSLLGMPPGGVHGDAVYSQEALDRIITQLMEQHQTGNAPGPASEEAIESLPKKQITQKDVGESGTADCSICMDEAAIGSTVTELPCGHWFHHDCVKAWLKEHDTCPHCRQGIMPKEGSHNNRARESSQAPLHDMHSPEYQRTNVPGEYPFPRQGSFGAEGSNRGGDGSRMNPFRVSESPERRRQGESSGGIFSRMREAFSPSSNPPSSNRGNTNSGDGNDTGGGSR